MRYIQVSMSIITIIFGFFFAMFMNISNLSAQESLLKMGVPSNPIAGRIVFEEKNCTDCHSIDGYGGNLGPDLGRDQFFGSFYDLASRLWNHAPQMVIRSDFIEKDWPSLDRSELNQLISYLFYLRFLGEPGSVSKGKQLVESKNCLKCHQIEGKGAKKGKALDKIKEFASPLYIAQSIWNHGPSMQKKMDSMGIERPIFEDEDITHITAYIREFNLHRPAKKQYMSPGNPLKGESLFTDKGCIKCHSTKMDDDSEAKSVGEMDLHRSVTAIAGTMWNHGNEMFETMKIEKIKYPKFRDSEMGDLISYLYFMDFKGDPGNADKGKDVFLNRSCSGCHGSEGAYEFESTISFKEPEDLIITMWNHVPNMQNEILANNLDWPELSPEDLQNLYAYLISYSSK